MVLAALENTSGQHHVPTRRKLNFASFENGVTSCSTPISQHERAGVLVGKFITVTL